MEVFFYVSTSPNLSEGLLLQSNQDGEARKPMATSAVKFSHWEIGKTDETFKNTTIILKIISEHYELLRPTFGSQKNADKHDSGNRRTNKHYGVPACFISCKLATRSPGVP